MTAIDDYKATLRHLIKRYNAEDVLEIGVEKGVSTDVFLREGCKLTSIDIEKPTYETKLSHYSWKIHYGDSSEVLGKEELGKFDMIFLDAFYTYKRLEHDVPLAWNLLNEGGILVFNEYIDFANHRGSEVERFVHNWANVNMRPFTVYPLRNGFAVFEK